MSKKEKIKELILNPRFYTNEEYKTLKNQGVPVRWMTEDEINRVAIFEIVVDEKVEEK